MPEPMRPEDVPDELLDIAVETVDGTGAIAWELDMQRVLAAVLPAARKLWWIEVFGDSEERRCQPKKPDSREEIQALIDASTERIIREKVAREIEAVDPVEWALAGQRAGVEAARIARTFRGEG